MKPKFLFILVALLAVLFFPSGIIVQAQSADSKISSPSSSVANDVVCQCVDYFVYKLNSSKRVTIGDWPTAASMAKPAYWDKTVYPRYRSQTAQAGDVVIMQDKAVVYPWNINTHNWDLYFQKNAIGYGAGHIGIVTKAEYWNDSGGWFITLRSANWSPAWGIQYSDAGCSNVSDSLVFIPNGDRVSFWRVKK